MTRETSSAASIVPHQSPTPNGTMAGFPVKLEHSSSYNMALAGIPNQSGQNTESREERRLQQDNGGDPPRVRLPVATAGISNSIAISKLQEDLANIELKYTNLKEEMETERAAIRNERDTMIADKALLGAEREAINEERLRLEQMKIVFNDRLRECREQTKAVSFESITVADAESLVDTHPNIIAAVQKVLTGKSSKLRKTLLQSLTDAELDGLIHTHPALRAAIMERIASESSKLRQTLLQNTKDSEARSLLISHPVMIAEVENKVREAKQRALLNITPDEARHLFHNNSIIVCLTKQRVAAGARIQQSTVSVKDKGYATLPQADIDEIPKSNPTVANKIRTSTESRVKQARAQRDIEPKRKLKPAEGDSEVEDRLRAAEEQLKKFEDICNRIETNWREGSGTEASTTSNLLKVLAKGV